MNIRDNSAIPSSKTVDSTSRPVKVEISLKSASIVSGGSMVSNMNHLLMSVRAGSGGGVWPPQQP